MSEYAERPIDDWENHPELAELYIKHVSAMTGEDLHSKAAIAAELAWRDYQLQHFVEQACSIMNAAREPVETYADEMKDYGITIAIEALKDEFKEGLDDE